MAGREVIISEVFALAQSGTVLVGYCAEEPLRGCVRGGYGGLKGGRLSAPRGFEEGADKLLTQALALGIGIYPYLPEKYAIRSFGEA